MNIDLTPEQEALRSAARRFMENEYTLQTVTALERNPMGYSPKLWADMAELGFPGAVLPEAHGGSGLGMVEVATLTREMGRVIAPTPFIPTVMLAGSVLTALGNEQQKLSYLPRIAAGQVVLAFALQEEGGGFGAGSVATTARPHGDGYVLTGQKRFVEFANAAERIIVAARTGKATDAIGLFLVDPNSTGVTLHPIKTLARDRQFHVRLENVRVAGADVIGNPGEIWSAAERAIHGAVVAFAGYMLGASERSMELSKDYACNRIQFNRPIASFQVIQHYLAQMAIEITAVEMLLYYAAWSLDRGHDSRVEVCRLKIGAGNTVKFTTSRSAEIYGGMGFVDEVDIAYYLRRGKQWQLQMGDTRFWQEELVKAVFARDAA